jgi:uroporphyrinogen decarboxylase
LNELKNDRFLKALRRQPTDRTPIWMMRQAGRYLPEYRAIREKAGSFMNLCTNPELACEVTLQPLERFEFDAAILFSDILTIPDAMGLGLHFVEGEGPKFQHPLRNQADVEKLAIPDIGSELGYVTDAVSLIRQELKDRVPLIGFSGSPWTLATYMVEGQSTREFRLIKGMLYEDPKSLHLLLDKLAQSVTLYLQAQIDAGAQAVQIFDTWGGVLSDAAYREFSLSYMAKIVDSLSHNTDIPIILFTKNGSPWLEEIADTGCHALGLDWSIGIDAARERVGDRVALQGNMDPAILRSTPEAIEGEVQRILDAYGSGPGHIFNLGHGITPDVLPDNVATFVRAVHERSVN